MRRWSEDAFLINSSNFDKLVEKLVAKILMLSPLPTTDTIFELAFQQLYWSLESVHQKIYSLQGFENVDLPNHVFKLDKALYGLKQAPRAWYERLSKFLLDNGLKRGWIDNTLFMKAWGWNLLIIQIYVDNIIFGATTTSHCDEFARRMSSEFEICMMGELNFFLGLQIK